MNNRPDPCQIPSRLLCFAYYFTHLFHLEIKIHHVYFCSGSFAAAPPMRVFPHLFFSLRVLASHLELLWKVNGEKGIRDIEKEMSLRRCVFLLSMLQSNVSLSTLLCLQYHAVGLLFHLRKTDRLAITKMVNKFTKCCLKSPFALCMLIRITSKLLEENNSQ